MSLFKNEKKIIVLKDKDFDEKNKIVNKKVIGKEGMVLVYASWCPHCVNFEPTWKQMAILADKNPICVLSVEQYPKIVERLNVKGFPTIFKFNKNGKLSLYKGTRDLMSLPGELCKMDKKNKICK